MNPSEDELRDHVPCDLGIALAHAYAEGEGYYLAQVQDSAMAKRFLSNTYP
ncbi:MAG: hypothetical protein HYV63_29435 [Candidatus Schekmanbacteria bacterium]|nr:hypothetical protein [Candidatus Schekmanbacteria bacterium]